MRRLTVVLVFCVVAAGCGGGGGDSGTGSGLVVTTSSVPGGTVGQAYSTFLAATGGTAPYVWSIPSGNLPGGLLIDAGSGEIAGTPTSAGTSNFTAQATDDVGATALALLSIVVAPAGGGGGGFAWALLSPTGTAPAGRASHGAVVDPANGRMVVTQGSDGQSALLADSFGLALTMGSEAWSGLPAGPNGRWAHTTVYDSSRSRLILFGGNAWQPVNEVWALSLSPGAEAWTPLSPGGATGPLLVAHGAVYDAANDRMVVFGGSSNQTPENAPTNNVWVLAFSGGAAGTWQALFPTGTPPSARVAMVCVLDTTQNRMLVFGGHTGHATGGANDVWALSLATEGSESWSLITPAGSPPGPRRYAAGAYDPVRNSLIVFGGEDGTVTGNYGDVWELDLTAGSEAWTPLSPSGSGPAARDSHTAAYDAVNGRIIFYGGFTRYPSTPFTDVWALELP